MSALTHHPETVHPQIISDSETVKYQDTKARRLEQTSVTQRFNKGRCVENISLTEQITCGCASINVDYGQYYYGQTEFLVVRKLEKNKANHSF